MIDWRNWIIALLTRRLSGPPTSGGRFSGMRCEIGAKGAMPRTADDAAKTPAHRMRSYRQRQRRQWRSIRVEIAAVEIDALVKRRY